MKIKKLGFLSVCAGLLMAHAGLSSAFTVDTSSSNGAMTGLWSNSSEPGWGGTITQQYGKIFAAIYSYESSGAPVWYTASDCPVTGSGCSGTLYKVTGGTPLTGSWNGTNLAVTPVGNITFSFADTSSGSVSYTINGASGTKNITRYVFASAPVGSGGGQVTASCTKANFTTAAYNAIAVGMSRNQVSQVMGCTNDPSFTQTYSGYLAYVWIDTTYSTFVAVIFNADGTAVTVPNDGSGQYKGKVGF